MMHERGKSDPNIVAAKLANKAAPTAAELVEQRTGAEGNASQQSTCRAQDRESVSQALERIRNAARQRKEERFTSLTHHISIAMLRMAFFALRRDAAPGVDGLTWQAYEADLDRNLTDLHSRVHRGAYRALPSRRQYIPKADGRQRPIAIAALEDKLVQTATVAVLNAIYEEDFVGLATDSAQRAVRTTRWMLSVFRPPDDLPVRRSRIVARGANPRWKSPGIARHRGVSSVLSVAVETGVVTIPPVPAAGVDGVLP